MQGGGGGGERLEKGHAFVQRSLFADASTGPANGDGRASADGVGEEDVGDGSGGGRSDDWGGAAPKSPTRRKERRPPTPKSPQYPLWSAGGF